MEIWEGSDVSRRMKKRKPTKKRPVRDRALDRAIAQVTARTARIEAAIDDLETTTYQLRAAARVWLICIGPSRNVTLIKLAQDILQEQIRTVLQDQMHALTKELALIAREEVQAEV